MAKAAGRLDVLEMVERGRRDGWLGGYRAALSDVERLAESRGDGADLPALIADLRADADAIQRDTKERDDEAPRGRLAADRLKTVAALRKQGLSLAEIARRIGVSKSMTAKLLREAGGAVHQSYTGARKVHAGGGDA